MYLEMFMTFRVEVRSYPVRYELLVLPFYSFGMGMRHPPIDVASNVIAYCTYCKKLHPASSCRGRVATAPYCRAIEEF